MKFLSALLLLIVGPAAGWLDLTVNGTVLCFYSTWGYQIKVWELDYFGDDFLGEVNKVVFDRPSSTYSLQLRDPEYDGAGNNYYDLGYTIYFYCGPHSYDIKIATSHVHIHKKRFNEEMRFNLMRGNFDIVSTCDENTCED
ncbi:unnamed protein product [Caenorhabditis brenneri]